MVDAGVVPAKKWVRWWCYILGLLLFLTGAFFVVAGGRLLSLGGSAYFLPAGLFIALSGVQIFRRRASGVLIYSAVFIATVIWALADVGLEFWPLVSRLFYLAVLLLLAMLCWPTLRRLSGKPTRCVFFYGASGVIVVCLAATGALMFQPHPTVAFSGQPLPLTPVDALHEQKDWDHYGNNAGGSRFVALDQITRDNVQNLKVAWTYHTGDTPLSPDGNGAEDQQTPLQVGNRVFLCTPHNNVIAIDADSGKELWKTEINAKSSVWMRCRGLAYFDATKPLTQPVAQDASPVPVAQVAPGALCQRRILMNTIDARLIALDAGSGRFCPDFGQNGSVDLKANMGAAADPSYVLTSAPTLAGSTVVVGGRVADNVSTDMPGGVIRGFDVITGAQRWAFDPRASDPNRELAAGESYSRSSPNAWAPMSYDASMNTLFIPMGSSSVDLWGADRTPLDHKYGASVLAVDATTGREKWVFQTVHNDLWDFDLPMQPSLIDFPAKDGGSKPALVIGTKAGQIYVLDRATGQPLTEVKEIPVKAGAIPGEQYSPTQPLSVGMPQIGAQKLSEADMWGATPFDQLMCRIAFKSMRYDGLYTVPDSDISLSFPGSLGGMNWGGMSTDPVNHYIFVNDMRLGLWIQMVKADPASTATNSGGESVNTGMGLVPMKGTPYAVNKNRFMSALGVPCQKPPFGTLSAIEMKTQQIVWQVPVGTVRDTGPLGVKMRLPIPVGLPTLGGTLATQGGLVFIAGTQDYYLRAFDSSTGKEVWKARLPVGSQGGPMSYKSPATGKQYVLISAGGGRQSPDRGDYVIAYALEK
ncbi:glucose/quinate/shikimate family membrane-bound PQQ-dependent dehydrogenase [Affinibrenneria salicis]|uniref:Glucose/quinate/shikimate family membrane-bound PQQ-dependent dehydrogenase n=1 Tax=Affinibrenneria salicis TaxID=2590031 RepID=A0A5J5G1L5_9GAMM|nr:glucose/quinate/shikimate family membrane-bound PQQ-dependent dehydrogenase [Affinibrenneria salicis]KAA9000538.1 glucose/quinate/shikimate family membrane-bound PQQ-dependent dehydrogenase [Affinibrenneria salicis]